MKCRLIFLVFLLVLLWPVSAQYSALTPEEKDRLPDLTTADLISIILICDATLTEIERTRSERENDLRLREENLNSREKSLIQTEQFWNLTETRLNERDNELSMRDMSLDLREIRLERSLDEIEDGYRRTYWTGMIEGAVIGGLGGALGGGMIGYNLPRPDE